MKQELTTKGGTRIEKHQGDGDLLVQQNFLRITRKNINNCKKQLATIPPSDKGGEVYKRFHEALKSYELRAETIKREIKRIEEEQK